MLLELQTNTQQTMNKDPHLHHSILQANLQAAEDLWSHLKELNNHNYQGKPFFQRKELDNGFSVTVPVINNDRTLMKDQNGNIVRKTIFTFLKHPYGNEIYWDDRYITLPGFYRQKA